MKTLILMAATLLLAVGPLWPQEPEPDELDTLRDQLQQAQHDVAEAAQRLARVQRELIESEGAQSMGHWREWHAANDGIEIELEFDDEHARHMVFAGFPPRLGVLLGDPQSEERNRVVGLTPGGGAEQAGIQPDDRLIAVAGQDVTERTGERVREALQGLEPGDTVEVLIRRDGEDHSLQVSLSSPLDQLHTIGQRLGPMIDGAIESEIFLHGGHPPGDLPPRLLGLGGNTELISNHDGLEPYFGTGDGVLVLRINDGNSLNLQDGDVIVAIDGQSVNHPVDLGRSLMGREPGSEIRLEVVRQRRNSDIQGTIPEPSERIGDGHRVIRKIRHRSEAPPTQ